MEGRAASGLSAPVGFSKLRGEDYYDPNDPTNHPHQTLGRAHLSIMRAAFACDLARVGTFSWAAATNWVNFPVEMDGAALLFPGGPTPIPMAVPHDAPLSADPIQHPDATAWWAAIDRF